VLVHRPRVNVFHPLSSSTSDSACASPVLLPRGPPPGAWIPSPPQNDGQKISEKLTGTLLLSAQLFRGKPRDRQEASITTMAPVYLIIYRPSFYAPFPFSFYTLALRASPQAQTPSALPTSPLPLLGARMGRRYPPKPQRVQPVGRSILSLSLVTLGPLSNPSLLPSLSPLHFFHFLPLSILVADMIISHPLLDYPYWRKMPCHLPISMVIPSLHGDIRPLPCSRRPSLLPTPHSLPPLAPSLPAPNPVAPPPSPFHRFLPGRIHTHGHP